MEQKPHPWFITGFCARAGNFTFSRTGFKGVNLYLLIRFNNNEKQLAVLLADYFEAGKLYFINSAIYYRATKMLDLEKVIAHFEKYPLQGEKNNIYQAWKGIFFLKKKNYRRKRWGTDNLTELSSLLKKMSA